MIDLLAEYPWALCHTIIIIGVTVLIAPLIRFILVGWASKKKDIIDGLNAAALRAYFERFSPSVRPPEQGKELVAFNELYNTWYGKRFYLLPALILLICGIVSVSVVVLTALDNLNYLKNPFSDIPVIAIAALSGAYLWCAHDLILRSRRLDLTPSDVLWCGLRFIVAVPMAYAFGGIFADNAASFIAFALGAFPLSRLLSILRIIANKKMDLGASEEEARDDIVKLQGVDRPIVERLENEDVTTVSQMAYCDPVQLVMRSNLSFNFITDCMNQALAWLYLEDKLITLRSRGLRGAVEIKNFIDALDDENPMPENRVEHETAVAALPEIAKAIAQDIHTTKVVFREIAGDPYTVFLSNAWD
jgi:hypothetical protein